MYYEQEQLYHHTETSNPELLWEFVSILCTLLSCLKRQDKTAIFALGAGIRCQEIRYLQERNVLLSANTTMFSLHGQPRPGVKHLKIHYLQEKTGHYDEVTMFWVWFFFGAGLKTNLNSTIFSVVRRCSLQFLEVILRWLSLPLTDRHRKTAPTPSSFTAAVGKQASSSDLQIIIIAH